MFIDMLFNMHAVWINDYLLQHFEIIYTRKKNAEPSLCTVTLAKTNMQSMCMHQKNYLMTFC